MSRIFQQLIAPQTEPAAMATITLVTAPPFVEKARAGAQDFSEDMSITKRYFTSLFSMRW
jgi:hypothetical protein